MVAVDVDVGAHAAELIDEREARLEHVLGAAAHAIGLGEQHHHLRLEVGGETRVRERDHIDRLQGPPQVFDGYRVTLGDDRDAGISELAQREGEVLGPHPLDAHATARQRSGDEVGPGLDAVRAGLPGRARQPLDTFDRDGRGPDTGDARTHRDEHPAQVGDLRLTRGVVDDRSAAGEGRSHDEVLGRTDRGEVEGDPGALETLRADEHGIVGPLDTCAHRLETGEVQLDRPRSDAVPPG